ncbi:MAG: mechanosensitive ion channel family protein [Ilumatobacter sp.]
MHALIAASLRAIDDAAESCGPTSSYLCERVFEETGGNETLARLAGWVVDRPLKILIILSIAWLLTRFGRRALERLVSRLVASDRAATRRQLVRLGIHDPSRVLGEDDPVEVARIAARKNMRAESISGVIGSTLYSVIWAIAIAMIIGELGLQLGPLIAGAGIAGVALGFGAQSLVKDCISGLFMLMEDQYGIGDVVDLGEAVGVVEEINLRTTVLRGLDGTVWHVPNGEVQRVGNKSQHYSVALVDIDVAYDSDLDQVRRIIATTAGEVCASDAWVDKVLAEPEILGVETLGADGVTLRMTVMVAPGVQWVLQREIRLALKNALDEAGIEIPFPQRTVWLRSEQA